MMYHENVNMPDGSTKNIVTVQTSAGTAYTNLVHGLRGFPSLFGEGGLNTPNVRYDAKWGWGTAYLFGLEDL